MFRQNVAVDNDFDTKLASMTACVGEYVIVICPSPKIRVRIIVFYLLQIINWDVDRSSMHDSSRSDHRATVWLISYVWKLKPEINWFFE